MIKGEALRRAWQDELPRILNPGDSCEVRLDGTDERSLRIHIDAAGRTGYSFDFKCTYVDDREVQVSLIDAEKDGRAADERTETMQQLIEDYVRHLHECAQALQRLTHA